MYSLLFQGSSYASSAHTYVRSIVVCAKSQVSSHISLGRREVPGKENKKLWCHSSSECTPVGNQGPTSCLPNNNLPGRKNIGDSWISVFLSPSGEKREQRKNWNIVRLQHRIRFSFLLISEEEREKEEEKEASFCVRSERQFPLSLSSSPFNLGAHAFSVNIWTCVYWPTQFAP